MNPIDNPIWASLDSCHANFARGSALAKRYRPEINVFAATRDQSHAALNELSALVAPGDCVYLLQRAEISVPKGLYAPKREIGVQMDWRGGARVSCEAEAIEPLGPRDAESMLALARATEPGPFFSQTARMGAFFGVRENGRLIAMAGERMRFAGHTEISGVCTDPAFRGRGLASRLSLHMVSHILARGDRPFLHAWKTNAPAIGLYTRLGFAIRCDVSVAVLERS